MDHGRPSGVKPPPAQTKRNADAPGTIDHDDRAEPAASSVEKSAVKTAKLQRKRPRGRPFKPGESGNPKGRPLGSRNRMTLAAEALLGDEALGITRKCVALALAGNSVALKLTVDRILPVYRDRLVSFKLPRMEKPEDGAAAMAAIVAAVADGHVSPAEAAELATVVQSFLHALETTQLEHRLRALEEKN